MRLGLVWDNSPYSAHVPSYHTSYYSFTITLASASSSCFTLTLPRLEVFCVGYTPSAWDPRSLQSVLNNQLYFVR